MRDSVIANLNIQQGKRIKLLFDQCNFLMTRLQAYEHILSSRKNMLKLFANPKELKQTVDKIQIEILARGEMLAKEQAEKPRLTVVTNGIQKANN